MVKLREGESSFEDLGLGHEVPAAISDIFNPDSILDEAIFEDLKTTERVTKLMFERFSNSDTAEVEGRMIARELSDALAELSLIGARVVVASREIIYRRTYTQPDEGNEATNYELGKVDEETTDEPEDLEPQDPNELVDTSQYRRTGKLALLPASKAHPRGYAVDSGQLGGIFSRVIKVDKENEDDPQMYRVALYYCTTRGTIGDMFERRTPGTFTNMANAEITIDQNTEIEEFKSALMELANLDEKGEPKEGRPMIDRYQLASLIECLTLNFEERFEEQNIKDINHHVCALQLEYRGNEEERGKLVACLQQLLNASFRVSPDTYFYVRTRLAVRYKEINVGGFDFTNTEIHNGGISTMKGPVKAIVLRDSGTPSDSPARRVCAPSLDIHVEKTHDGRPLKSDDVSDWLIPLASVVEMGSSFSTA